MAGVKRIGNFNTPLAKKGNQQALKISDAIKYLKDPGINFSEQCNKAFLVEIKCAIMKHAASHGLLPSEILDLTEAIAEEGIDNATKTSLISCLIPSSVVPMDAAHIMLSFATSKKSSDSLKEKIFSWMIAVFQYIEYRETLNRFHHLFFYWAQDSTLCHCACHLLSLTMQKEDVKLFYVRRVKNLKMLMGDRPYILGLLHVFHLFRPDLVTAQPRSNTKYFATNRKWIERLRTFRSENPTLHRQLHPACSQPLDFVKSNRKEAQYSSKSVNFNKKLLNEIGYEQMNSVQEMIDNIHKLEPPRRIESLLHNNSLKLIILSKADPTVIPRVSNWIKATMVRVFVWNKDDYTYDHREEILGLLVQLTEDIQEGIPCVEEVLSHYLVTWSGSEHRTKVLALISKWRMCPFDQLTSMLLDSLRRLFFRCSKFFKCEILECFVQMIHHMAMIELPRYACALVHSRLLSEDHSFTLQFRSVFPSVTHHEIDVLDVLRRLIEFVVSLSDAGLRIHNYHPLLAHHSLSLYEKLNELRPAFGIPKLLPISKTLMYHCLFSFDASFLSRACSILSSQSSTLAMLDQSRFTDEKQSIRNYSLDVIKTLLDNEGFTAVSDLNKDLQNYSIYNGKYTSMQTQIQGIGIKRRKASLAFSIFKHPALLNFSKLFSNQESKNKKEFIDHLRTKHFDGFYEFEKEFVNEDI